MRSHTSRQWMITHEWMVKPMQQTEWIEKKGLKQIGEHGFFRPSPHPLQAGTWASAIVKNAAKALGLHQATSPHSFRHYRATQLLNEGMPLESVQAYLGHVSIETTRIVYAHTHTAVLEDQLETYGRSAKDAANDIALKGG